MDSTSPPAPSTDDPGARPSKRLVTRALVVATVLGLILFWIWILVGGPKKQNPDYLDDREWATDAEATCAATLSQIEALPTASSAASADERADVLDQANALLDTMLADLSTPLPAGAADREVTQPWLEDWQTYLGDRRDYADALRTDPGADFLVREKFSDPIDTVIEVFAKANEMPSCSPPDDVG